MNRRISGFTLVEILVVVVLSSLILAAVMSIFLFLTRAGINAQQYRDMDSEARRTLELLSRDMRMADSIKWDGSAATTTKVRLSIPKWNSTSNRLEPGYVYYRLVPVPTNSPLRTRLGERFLGRFETATVSVDPDTDGVADEEQYEPLQTHIATNGLEFRRFERGDTYTEASNELETKQVKLELRAERKWAVVARTTQYLISARFVLRNKVVAQ